MKSNGEQIKKALKWFSAGYITILFRRI